MNTEELVAKILAECVYHGPNRAEGYMYYKGVGEAIAVIRRELPPDPIPEPAPVKYKDSKKKKGDEELGTPGSPYDSKE